MLLNYFFTMDKIFEIETIEELSTYLKTLDPNKSRKNLLKEFDRLYDYKNILEWNKLVRVCEALRIIGWGKREALETFAEKWINGSFYTYIQNQYFEKKSCERWCKKNKTFILDNKKDTKDYGVTKLESQRNLLPKSPIRWSLSGNHQKSVEPLYKEFDKLKNLIVKNLRPELYGDDFSYLGLNLYFSYHDATFSLNGITLTSTRHEYFHSQDEVPKEFKGKYSIKPRFKVGNLSKKTGEWKLVIDRYFTRAFGEKKIDEQKRIITEDFQEFLDILSEKLKKKKVNYGVSLLKNDLKKIMKNWNVG